MRVRTHEVVMAVVVATVIATSWRILILSQDILTVPEEQIRSTQPLATYVGGEKVFDKGEGK